MKKMMIAAVAMLPLLSMAQSNKVTSAWKQLDYYEKNQDADLNKAKTYIEEAINHPDTKEEAKTWFYRGGIYYSLFDARFKAEMGKLKGEADANKATLTAYANTPTADLVTALESYTKAKELDKKDIYGKDITKKLKMISQNMENCGVAAFQNKNYADALSIFEKTAAMNEAAGKKDTVNLYNAALSAERSNNPEKAKALYNQLIALNYNKPAVYSAQAEMYMSTNDTAGAKEILKKGRTLFPNEVALLTTETNIYLKENKRAEAIKNLEDGIKLQPNNENLYLVLGNTLDNMANPKDDKGGDLPKPKDYEDLLKKAEFNYKKAIELKPDYFDAQYNLGVLYFNHGVELSRKADAIMDQKKYDLEYKKVSAEYDKAIPHLEKALELQPKDQSLLYALKQIYTRTQQTEKLKKIKEMMGN